MKFSDLPLNPDEKTLRDFSIIGCAFCAVLTGIQVSNSGIGPETAILPCVGLVWLSVGLVYPRFLRPVFVAWMILAFPLGWTMSMAILLVTFYVVIVPIGLILRCRGHDPLRLNRPPAGTSLWIDRPTHADVKQYLKQY